MAKFEAATGRYVWLEIQGVEYRVYFEEAGQGIPLICQHTAGSDGKQWRHFLTDPDITSRFRVIVPDLPYHGKSLPPESQEWWAHGIPPDQILLHRFPSGAEARSGLRETGVHRQFDGRAFGARSGAGLSR